MARARERSASEGPARLFRRLSLRTRLLLGLVVVSMVGVVAADVVVYGQIRSYLIGQVDKQLQSAEHNAFDAVQDSFAQLNFPNSTPPGTIAAVLVAPDSTILQTQSGPTEATNNPLDNPAPQYPKDLVSTLTQGCRSVVQGFRSVPDCPKSSQYLATGGSYAYEVLAVPVGLGSPISSYGALVIAIPLASLNGTLRQLVLVDLVASAALLLALAGLGYLVVRVGLRPLGDIEGTAMAIAAGDLSRRVADDDPATEVGRLGASLNEMLATIEHAFSEQQASESRLRQFLADVSHELRTPITSIRGYAELFRRGAATRPEDLVPAMQRIEDESIRMGVLVDDLLLLARLDQGRPLELAPFDLAGAVADAAADAQVLEPSRDISVELPETLVVQGDEVRIRQVVGNLFQNALRYSPPGSPIEVTLRHEGDNAVLRVTDHGIGIAPEHLPHVFERFYRADPSRTRDRGGSGLGLSIVASILEAHGGSVSVASTVGEGSVFSVELPIPPQTGAEETPSGYEVPTPLAFEAAFDEEAVPRAEATADPEPAATTAAPASASPGRSDRSLPIAQLEEGETASSRAEAPQGNSETEVRTPGPL